MYCVEYWNSFADGDSDGSKATFTGEAVVSLGSKLIVTNIMFTVPEDLPDVFSFEKIK